MHSRRILITTALLGLGFADSAPAYQSFITGPPGSHSFGSTVTILPNGNFVVTDSGYVAPGPLYGVGAVYLYTSGGKLLSVLTGSRAWDSVGSGGVTVLSNGHFVISSPSWSNGSASRAGAVTWGSCTAGVSGVVSAANSLVGSTTDDRVGSFSVSEIEAFYDSEIGTPSLVTRITILENGHYFVRSSDWDNGTAVDAGAVTWCNGTTGTAGEVSDANSLVGTSSNDRVGGGETGSAKFTSLVPLGNGNHVIVSPFWRNGSVLEAGAVTWVDGARGISGKISADNSLVGTTDNQRVGAIELVHRKYVLPGGAEVRSSEFREGVKVLGNGNYLVCCPSWDDGTLVDAGAVTWASGATGISGIISRINSLVGTSPQDAVGYEGDYRGAARSRESNLADDARPPEGFSATPITILSNGNYVIASPAWNGRRGAVTWGSATIGVSGFISPANSLTGSTEGDAVGVICTALANGHYVVSSPWWNGGRGAVTWGDGQSGMTGPISAANSVTGSRRDSHSEAGDGDFIGALGVTALVNGNYVINSPGWFGETPASSGAVTWGKGSGGTTGVVSAANSLVGFTYGFNSRWWNDFYRSPKITALTNGNYVVATSGWNRNRGAVTWASGATVTTGTVSALNSLVGSTADNFEGNGDLVGSYITVLTGGNYVVTSLDWQNGSAVRAGAVTWGNGTTGVSGPVSPENSLVGTRPWDAADVSLRTDIGGGNYLVVWSSWDDGESINTGAVTWCSGTAGTTGPISPENSLIGGRGVTVLTNGNYVVISPEWNGAVTWASGTTGKRGRFSAEDSLVGMVPGEGPGVVTPLTNGNFVVARSSANIAGLPRAGAITWGNGLTGVGGVVSELNSLVGSTAEDKVGSGGIIPLIDGNFVVLSRYSDNGSEPNTGAVSLADGMALTSAPVSVANSAVGTHAIPLPCPSPCVVLGNPFSGPPPPFAIGYDPILKQLVSGLPYSNRVVRFTYVPPDISVEYPQGTRLTLADVVHLGIAPVSGSSIHTFTIRNNGTADLSDLVIGIDGPNAAEFAATTPVTTVVGTGELTTFTVRFAPSTVGPRTATMRVASNDPDENPFVLTLIGSHAPVTMLPGGHPSLAFQAIAGRNYQLQRTGDLMTWTTLATLTAGPDGAVSYTDLNAPAPKAFYRLQEP